MALKITGTNTAAAPGITGDDTDTGLFYGTDTIGFSTGATERLRIASDGDLTLTGADNAEIKMKCGTSSGNNILAFLNSGGTTRGNITYDSDNDFLLFNVNQSERFRITSGGDVLVATTTDSLWNDTSGGGFNLKTSGQLVIAKQATSVGDPLIWLNDTGQTTNKTILLAQDGTEKANIGLAGNDLTLATAATERFRITSTGLVGINSTIPRSKLHAANGSSNYNPGNPTGLGAGAVACLESSGDVALQFLSSNTTDNFIYFGDTDSATTGSIQYDHNVNDLLFNINGGTERLRITSDGAVRIGNLQTSQNSTTHTSATKLHIDSTKSIKIARLGAGSITSAGWFTVAKIASAVGNYFKCYASIGGDFTQDMCVMELTGSWSASGGLSNSYAEPVFTAHRTGAHSTDRITRARFVKDSSNITYFQIYIASGHSSYWGKSVLEYQVGAYAQNGADSGSAAMFAAGGTVTDIRTLELVDNALCTNAGTHKIYTGGTERLRITSAGNLEKKGGGSYLAYDSQAHLAKQDNYDTNGGKSYWYDASATNGGVNQAYIDGQTGNIMAKGNFVVGTAGKGIDFSNQTATSTGSVDSTGEILDHYEEGSWTPSIDGLSNTPTYHNKVGKYTRIGNIVKCQGFIQIANTKPTFSNTQSVFTISGLPFTSQGTGYNQVIGNVCWSQIDWVGPSRSTYGHVDDTQLTVGIVSSTKCEFKTMGQAKYYMGQLKNIVFHDDGSWILEWDMTYYVAT